MQFKQIFLAVCLSGFALGLPEGHHKNGTAVSGADKPMGTGTMGHKGKGHHKNGTSADFECAELSKLTKLTKLANNATALSELETKHNLTAAEVAKIKESAANATTKLTTLQSNTTLTTQCAVVDAHAKVMKECKEMSQLMKLSSLVNNATAMSELESKHNLTAAEISKIKEGAANATMKLTKLQSNTTLVAACSAIKTTKSNSTSGNANAQQSTSAAVSIRSISNVGHMLANAIFALAMGGMALSLMA